MTLVDKSLEQMLGEIEFTNITRCDYKIPQKNSRAQPIKKSTLQDSGGIAVVEEISDQYICDLLYAAGIYHKRDIDDMDSNDFPLWQAIKMAIWGVYAPANGVELPFCSMVRVGVHGCVFSFENEGDGFDYVKYISFMRKSIKEQEREFYKININDDRLCELAVLDRPGFEASYKGNGNTVHIMVKYFNPRHN